MRAYAARHGEDLLRGGPELDGADELHRRHRIRRGVGRGLHDLGDQRPVRLGHRQALGGVPAARGVAAGELPPFLLDIARLLAGAVCDALTGVHCSGLFGL